MVPESSRVSERERAGASGLQAISRTRQRGFCFPLPCAWRPLSRGRPRYSRRLRTIHESPDSSNARANTWRSGYAQHEHKVGNAARPVHPTLPLPLLGLVRKARRAEKKTRLVGALARSRFTPRPFIGGPCRYPARSNERSPGSVLWDARGRWGYRELCSQGFTSAAWMSTQAPCGDA